MATIALVTKWAAGHRTLSTSLQGVSRLGQSVVLGSLIVHYGLQWVVRNAWQVVAGRQAGMHVSLVVARPVGLCRFINWGFRQMMSD